MAGKAFDWNVLRQVLKYVRPYRWQTTLAAGLSVFLGILSTARPILVRDGVDYAVVSADWQALYHAMMWLAGALVLEALGQFAFIYATNDLGQRVIKDIRIKLFGKLLHFKMPFFDKTPVGHPGDADGERRGDHGRHIFGWLAGHFWGSLQDCGDGGVSCSSYLIPPWWPSA